MAQAGHGETPWPAISRCPRFPLGKSGESARHPNSHLGDISLVGRRWPATPLVLPATTSVVRPPRPVFGGVYLDDQLVDLSVGVLVEIDG